MILPMHRKLAIWLVRLRIWRMAPPSQDLFSCARLRPRWGTKWLWRRMRAAQAPDDRKHAPCCPANRWSGVELVIQRCECWGRK